MDQVAFKFPQKIDSYLAAAYELAKIDGNLFLAEILKSARPEFTLDVWRDEFDGCVYYHNLVLHIPVSLFESIGKRKSEAEQRLQKLMESVSIDIPTERIQLLSLLPDVKGLNWRGPMKSGRAVSAETITRIWRAGRYKIFISHLSKDKVLASGLKKQLSVFGCASFVAHEDIEPTKEWQDEIECALHSMDCLVALMTEGFHKSNWTDQEVGFACGRDVKIIPISLGEMPYGFVGKFQAIKWSEDDSRNMGWEVFKRLSCFKKEEDAFVDAVSAVDSYSDAVELAKIMSSLSPMTEKAVRKITDIAIENSILRKSMTFWEKTTHSLGFHHYIWKWLGYDLQYDDSKKIYSQVPF